MHRITSQTNVKHFRDPVPHRNNLLFKAPTGEALGDLLETALDELAITNQALKFNSSSLFDRFLMLKSTWRQASQQMSAFSQL